MGVCARTVALACVLSVVLAPGLVTGDWNKPSLPVLGRQDTCGDAFVECQKALDDAQCDRSDPDLSKCCDLFDTAKECLSNKDIDGCNETMFEAQYDPLISGCDASNADCADTAEECVDKSIPEGDPCRQNSPDVDTCCPKYNTAVECAADAQCTKEDVTKFLTVLGPACATSTGSPTATPTATPTASPPEPGPCEPIIQDCAKARDVTLDDQCFPVNEARTACCDNKNVETVEDCASNSTLASGDCTEARLEEFRKKYAEVGCGGSSSAGRGAGIAIGVIVLLIALGAGGLYLSRSRRSRQTSQLGQGYVPTEFDR